MSFLSALKRFFGLSPKSSPNDRHLDCEDCGKQFVFDEGEQQFFRTKGFSDPKRCPRCRKQIKFRLRRRKRGGGGGGGGGGNGHHQSHHNDNQGNRHGRRRGHSVIDGRSPYADER